MCLIWLTSDQWFLMTCKYSYFGLNSDVVFILLFLCWRFRPRCVRVSPHVCLSQCVLYGSNRSSFKSNLLVSFISAVCVSCSERFYNKLCNKVVNAELWTVSAGVLHSRHDRLRGNTGLRSANTTRLHHPDLQLWTCVRMVSWSRRIKHPDNSPAQRRWLFLTICSCLHDLFTTFGYVLLHYDIFIFSFWCFTALLLFYLHFGLLFLLHYFYITDYFTVTSNIRLPVLLHIT